MSVTQIRYNFKLRLTGHDFITFAISLQLLLASRIAFNLCSSSAVQGVFVRPFFLGVVSSGSGTCGMTGGKTPVSASVIRCPAIVGGERLFRGFAGWRGWWG